VGSAAHNLANDNRLGPPPTLGDQARFGLLAFQILIYVQLCLLLFFAALSAAGTIAQEKDRRTFLLCS